MGRAEEEEEEERKTKTGRGCEVEKVEKEPKTQNGAPWPDHTDTLRSVSPCQLCTAVDSERTRSHTHILKYAHGGRWEHTWPASVCVSLTVLLSVSVRPCILKPPEKPHVCFPLQPPFVVSRHRTCVHICVCTGMFARPPERTGACSFPSVASRSTTSNATARMDQPRNSEI